MRLWAGIAAGLAVITVSSATAGAATQRAHARYLSIGTARAAISKRLHQISSGSVSIGACYRTSTTRVVCGFLTEDSVARCSGRMAAWISGAYLYTQGVGHASCQTVTPPTPPPPPNPTPTSPSTPTPTPPALATPDLTALPVSAFASPNWSGYAAIGGPFTAVTGTFNVPTLYAAPTPAVAAEWIGIDGMDNNALIQAGVSEIYDPAANLVYFQPWWEILPAPATNIATMRVSPNDLLSVTIASVGGSNWQILIVDNTTGQTFTITKPYYGPTTSAEWIVEAPTAAATGRIVTLGQYTPLVTFSHLGLTGASTALRASVLVENGEPVSVPSVIDQAGFNVAYGSQLPPSP